MLGDRQRGGLAGAGQHERELLAAEPRGHVGVARGRPQHLGEAPQDVVAGVVAERVVDALEVVEVDHQQRQLAARAELVEVAVDRELEAAAVAQPGQRIVGGEVLEPLEPPRGLDRAHRLVGEHAQRLQRLVGGQQPVLRVVDPDHPVDAPGRVVQRHDDPVVVPGQRPAAVADRRVDAAQLGRDLQRLVALHDDAAVAHALRVEQRLDRLDRHVRELRGALRREADARQRHQLALVGEEGDDLVEAERLAHAPADGVEHLLLRAPLGQLRRDGQQVLHGRAVPAPQLRGLRLLDRDRRVGDDRAQQLQLDRRRAAAGDRLVDRHDPEQRAVGRAQRDHQRVVGVPGVGVVGDLEHRRVGADRVLVPVVLAGGDEVRAVAQEALAQQPRPVLHPGGLAHQQLLRLLVAEHDDDLEVVPRRAVEVDHDRAVAQRAGDRAGDRLEHGAQLTAGPDRGGDVEQAAQAVDGRVVHLWVIGSYSATLTAHSSS